MTRPIVAPSVPLLEPPPILASPPSLKGGGLGMAADLPWFWCVAACVKLLLAPAYRSTDFEVHRHWLALTSSLPLSRWYADASSLWTLDYPPLFAYFERLLSILAALVDPAIVDIRNHGYDADSAILFQRLSVVFADLSLLLGAGWAARRLPSGKRRLVYALVLWSPALLIVDHVHFQYNGLLLGVLLLSIALLAERRDLAGAVAFAVLMCSKHLFAVAAPVYFVYLLRHYCRGGGFQRDLGRFLGMGAAVGVVFALSFGPFLYHGQMQQVLQRLFPFGRGLCHAYWAPNFWVFYIIFDKVITLLLRKLGCNIEIPSASFTGGLVGSSTPFAVLPQISPAISLILVILAMCPCLIKAWRDPQPKHIARWVAYAYTCGFLFGWHVHEKASLHFVIPLAITAVDSLDDARHYFLLATVSCYSMFPLLFGPEEYPIKILLLVIHSVIVFSSLSSFFSKSRALKGTERNELACFVGRIGSCYLLGLVCVELWGQFFHPYILGDKFPFLPLMLVSTYCAVGMMYSWLWQLRRIYTINTAMSF